MTTQRVIRILIADDHPVVRDGLVAMLSTQLDFRVVGQASSGSEVIANVEIAEPDVVLLDIEIPELYGVEVLRLVISDHPELKILVFTTSDDDERIKDAARAGAKGYLLKSSPRDEVFEAIRAVSQGATNIQPANASKPIPSGSLLTARELEVLELLAQGMMNKEIASKLVITVRTVKFHVSSILRKLEAGNRTEAVRSATERGIIDM